tara:strand:+ start:6492 stop:9278 length:2787 start_codon:yes stop_codon:yes gene_type:complete
MNKIVKGFMFLTMGTFLFSQNILTNPSFEDSLTGWNIYPADKTNRSIESTGNKVYGSERTVTARSGTKLLKTWGQYNGGANTTPSYYEGDTEAGKVYNFSVYGMTHADDKLRNNAKAWIQIKFFDSSWSELAGGTSDTMSAASDTNAWHYLYTNATAPANAAKVQAVIVHSQDGGDDHGAVYWDDAYLTMNHFTQIGVVSSKMLWAGSGGDVRGMAAGSDLDGDGKKEVWATHYNVPGYKGGLGGDGVYGFEYVGADTLVQIFDETAPFAPNNILTNPGFEDSLATWNVYPATKAQYASVTSGNSTDKTRNGSLMLKMSGIQDASNGASENPRYYENQDATPGHYYIFEGYGYTPASDSLVGTSQAFLWLKFFDASWGMIGSDSSSIMDSTTPSGKWTPLVVSGTAPAGTKTIQAVVNYSNSGAAGAWGGVAHFDDMALWRAVGPKSTYGTGTRNVATGDLDGDGKGEVIFVKGRYTDDPQSGVWVYEADGTDNGFSAPWHVNINAFASDSVKWGTTENVVVDDIDGDGRDELMFSFNGGSNPNAGYSTYSEDRFFVMGVEGDIGVLPKPVEEFVIAPRDRNKDGVRGNDHGGGSAVSMVVADTDGDGKKEMAFFSWNGGNMFVAEATGANTYAAPDSGEYVRFGSSSFPGNTAGKDDFSFNPTAIDMDGDGKDEIYATGYYTQNLYVYADRDGDAMKIDSSEVSLVARGHRFGLAAVNSVKDHGAGYFNMSPYGVPTLFAGGNSGSELAKITLRADSSVLGGVSSWDVVKYDTKAGGGFNNKPVAGVDFNRNGKGEVVLAYQGTDDGGTYIQIMEYSESSVKLSVERELTIITPEDYKLSQNYPNPFNPTTTIQYTLPMRDQITVTVYNMLGQEVVRLMNNESKPAGTYQLSWNGMDKNGVQVSSGMYFYTMSSPHMQKTMRMTFLK